MACADECTRIVYPSGSALATDAAPMVPPAPVRFSTTTAWPSRAASWSETVRAMMSMALPAVTGTITRSGLLGQACACASCVGAPVEPSNKANMASARHHMDRLPVAGVLAHTRRTIAHTARERAMRLALIVVGALLAIGDGQARAAELKIASPQRGSWEGSVPELGRDIFRKHGLDLDILYTAGGGETLQAVISGAVDIGLSA